MNCKCPEGYPEQRERGFGEYADTVADTAGIPRPRYGVEVHVAPCELSDEPHKPLDDVLARLRSRS